MRGLQAAVAFLTVIPAAGRGGGAALRGGAGVAWYGVAGALLGGLLAGMAAGAWELWPGAVAGAAMLAAWAILTGALHLDGLADTADGAFAPVDRERRQAILRDVHHGTFGIVAIAIVLILKFSVLASAGRAEAASLILIAAVTGRAAIAPLLRLGSPARPDGMGHAVHGQATVHAVAINLATVAAACLVAGGWPGLAIGAGGLALAGLTGAWCAVRFGGLSGDLLGATVEIVETGVLLGGAAWLGRGFEPFPWVGG